MSDLTPTELTAVLKAHGRPGQVYRNGRGMMPSCPLCPFEKYPCLTYRLAREVQRQRGRQLDLFAVAE